jgi:hypothetical protein
MSTIGPGTCVRFTLHGTEDTPFGTIAFVRAIEELPDDAISCSVCAPNRPKTMLQLSITRDNPWHIGWCPNHWQPVDDGFEEAKREKEEELA